MMSGSSDDGYDYGGSCGDDSGGEGDDGEEEETLYFNYW